MNIPRRNAKTHSILSFLCARIFRKANQRWAFIAAAEDQAGELIHTKLVRPLSRPHLGLVGHFKVGTTAGGGFKLEVPEQNSWIEILPTSAASGVGRGNTGVAIDECRDVKADVPAAVQATIYDAHGWECPSCLQQWHGETAREVCPKDGRLLERWHGRLVFASSSGAVKDVDTKDWFGNLVRARIEQPVPEAHVFATEKIINPSVSVQIVDASMSIFSGVPALEDLVAVEASNRPMRPGDVYLKPDDVKGVVDKRGELRDACESDRAAVWFLDTSDKVDLCTLAVLVDDAGLDEHGQPEKPFTRVALRHLKIWDPNDRRQLPAGVIDDEEVAEYLALVHENFTRLRRRQVDTRGRPWAISMLDRIKRHAFGRSIESYNGKQVNDDAGWEALHDYVVDRRIRIPRPLADEGKQIFPGMDPHARLLRELPALKKVDRKHGGMGVEDPNADRRGRNKNKKGLHRDAAAALAGAALLAWEERKKLAGSHDRTKTHAVNLRGRDPIVRRDRSGIWTEKS